MLLPPAVALACALPGQVGEPRLGRVARRDARAREPGCDEAQVEGRARRHLAGVAQGLGIGGVQAGHLGGRAQERAACPQVGVGLLQRGADAGRREDIAEGRLGRRGHARPRRGHQHGSRPPRQIREDIRVLRPIPRRRLPLDEHAIGPSDRLREGVDDPSRPRGPTRTQGTYEGAPPAPGQGDEAAPGPAHVLQGEAGRALPLPGQRPRAHHAHEVFVPVGPPGQQRQTDPRLLGPGSQPPAPRMGAGNNRAQRVGVQGDLGPVDDGEPAVTGRHRGLHGRIHAVHVEDGERVQAQARGLRHHVGGLVGAL